MGWEKGKKGIIPSKLVASVSEGLADLVLGGLGAVGLDGLCCIMLVGDKVTLDSSQLTLGLGGEIFASSVRHVELIESVELGWVGSRLS